MSRYEHGEWRRYLYDECRCNDCLTGYRVYHAEMKATFSDRLAAGKTTRRRVIPAVPPVPATAAGFGFTGRRRRRRAP